MKVCVVGAGAVGGLLGVRLAQAGAQVSALARGQTLQALQRDGWRLHLGGQWQVARVSAADDAAALGPQDLVVVAVKGPALAEVAPRLSPLMHARTIVMPAMNGVPWWFEPGLRSVDPDGAIERAIEPRRVIGCVVHASAMNAGPGVVEHQRGQGLIVGEPDGSLSERVQALGDWLRRAGFDTTVSDRIRKDIWYKLWGNLTTNPISAVTGATTDRILADPLVARFCVEAMAEAKAVGERIGCELPQTPQQRHEVTRQLGVFKTSMLQDAEAGRALELDAIVGAVRELGRRHGVPTPQIDTLFGIARLFARVHGLYPEAAPQA